MKVILLAVDSGTALMAAGGGLAAAQSQPDQEDLAAGQSQCVLDSVTVTGQKRARDFNAVPMSIAALTV